jgi:2-succinyl-5-enolpyruvyl-6-hydroxy-3-cyclohexene-1-carboxylate synthase
MERVANNGGGAIFASLEQRVLPELDELFTTPHGTDLGAIVRAAGARHVPVESAGELVPAVRTGLDGAGVHVLEVRIDPERDRTRRAQIRAAVDEAFR